MRPSPTPPRYGAQELTTGKVRYDKTTIKLIEEQVEGWQYKTRGVLAGCFPGNNEHKQTFERTIVSERMYYDAKAEFEKEIKEGRNVLNAIIVEESLKMRPMTSLDAKPKKPLIFISHRGTQTNFVSALVDLLEKCKFSKDNLFCSSVPGFNIALDDDIIDTLRSKFVDYRIYVISLVSTKKS